MWFKFIKTKIPELIIIEPQVFWDERWFFMETYSKKAFQENWINIDFIQDNHSKSKKWVLRGLHFQYINPQDKLVRVVSGAVYDVAVDVRKWSPTFWQWVWVYLSAENKKQFFIPKWFAHWFLTLEDNTEFVYKVSDYYNSNWEWGYMWNEPAFWIFWNEIFEKYWIKKPILSEKDKNYKPFSKGNTYFNY